MSEIQPIVISEILNFVSGSIKSARVIVEGIETIYPIYKTRISEDTLRKYIYLDDLVRGRITRAALIDVQGREWFVKGYDYVKGQDGFVIVFPIRQTIAGALEVINEEEDAIL